MQEIGSDDGSSGNGISNDGIVAGRSLSSATDMPQVRNYQL